MPTSTSRLSYPDCENFLNVALEDEVGARLPFLLKGAAYQFQVRLNTFRAICRKDNAKVYSDREHPFHGRCEYDPVGIYVQGPDANGEWWVVARKRKVNEAEIELLSEVEGVANGP